MRGSPARAADLGDAARRRERVHHARRPATLPTLLIIARAEQSTTVKKLKHAGADHVVLPSAIGAHRIVSLVTNPAAVQFAELVTKRTSLAIEMDEMPIMSLTPWRA